MIDTPFQLLDSNSEETGLVCGIDGCSIERALNTAVRNSLSAIRKKQKSSH